MHKNYSWTQNEVVTPDEVDYFYYSANDIGARKVDFQSEKKSEFSKMFRVVGTIRTKIILMPTARGIILTDRKLTQKPLKLRD